MFGQRRSRALVGMAVAAIAPATACLLTSSFDNVAGIRPQDSGSPDAAPEDVEGGANNADAEADADGGEAGPLVAFCKSQTVKHTICADFDEGPVTSGGFSKPVGVGGMVNLDSTQFVSAPNSMMASTIRVADMGRLSAILSQDLKLKPKGMTVDFDMRVASCQSTGGPVTLFVLSPSKSDVYGFIITGSNVFQFSEQHGNLPNDGGLAPRQSFTLPTPAPNTWNRIGMTVAFEGDGGTVALRVNGVQLVSSPLIVGITPDGTLLMNFGVNVTGPVDPCVVYFDNVVVDIDKADAGN